MHEWAVINSKHMSWISGCGKENERNKRIPKEKKQHFAFVFVFEIVLLLVNSYVTLMMK